MTSHEEDAFPFWPLIIGATVIVFFLWGGGFLILRYALIGDWETRAQAGDTFGGITSLFSGLAFAGLIVTLWMQRHELRLQRLELIETREELSRQRAVMEQQTGDSQKQNLETTFFRRLQHFETIIAAIDRQYRDGEVTGTAQGRDALERIARTVRRATLFSEHQSGENAPRTKNPVSRTINEEGWQDRYRSIYLKLESDLGNYFRVLYTVIDHIDTRGDLSEAEKYAYVKIVRASLTPDECLLIFFNAHSEFASTRMRDLIARYALLKHLPHRFMEEAPFIVDKFAPHTFGHATEATAIMR